MAETSRKDALLKEWKSRYAPLTSGFYVPTSDPFEHKKDQAPPTNIVVRDMVVDMEELNTKLGEQAPDWVTLDIYADVLVWPLYSKAYGSDIGGQFGFKLGHVDGQKINLFARTIIMADGSGAIANFNPETELNIYTHEIVGGSLFFAGLQDDLRKSIPIELEEGAAGISIKGSEARSLPIASVPAALLDVSQPALWLLQSSFNVGSALAYDDPELAIKILSWVARAANSSTNVDANQLALNAANFQGFVTQLQSKVPFVPELTAKMYEDVTTKYLKAAENFETDFKAITRQASTEKGLSGFVSAQKGYFTDKSSVGTQLIADLRKSVDASEAILAQNSRKMHDLTMHHGTLEAARNAFKAGIEKYKEEQKRKAIIGVCMAVFEVGASLGAMAAGDEAAAGGAVKGVTKAAEAGKAAAKSVSKIKKLVEAVKKIAKVIKKIGELVKKLKAAQEAIDKLTKANDMTEGDFTKGIEVKPDDGEIFDNAYWEVFTINVTDLLTPYKSDIDGTGDYLEQLLYLGVYGKAVYANSLTLTNMRQKLLKLTLEQKVVVNQQSRLDALVKENLSEAEKLERAKILYYQCLLRVKGRVIFYMSEQIAACRYWAAVEKLPEDLLPSLQDDAGNLNTKLGKIAEMRIDKLKHFKPHPGPMHIQFKITDPELLDQLRENRQFSYTIDLDNPKFVLEEDVEPGHPAMVFGRVRVSDITIHLNEEAISDRDEAIKFDITDTGHYFDRYHGAGQLEYVSKPSEMVFSYALDRDIPIAPNNAARKFEGDYFEPTPFTTWTIRLLNDVDDLKLENLKEVTLFMDGTWAAYNPAGPAPVT